MAICKFHQQGGCKFGNRCYNEHIDPQRNNYSQPQRYANQKQTSSGFSFTKAFEQVTRVEPARHVHFDETRNRYDGYQRREYYSDPRVGEKSYRNPSATTGFSFSKTFNQIKEQPSSIFNTPQHDVSMSMGMENPSPDMYSSFSVNQSHSMYSTPQQVVSSPWQPNVTNLSVSNQSMGDSQLVVTSNLAGSGKEYTLITDLSPEELESFKAESFSFGKIPLKPPPLELCK